MDQIQLLTKISDQLDYIQGGIGLFAGLVFFSILVYVVFKR